MTVARDEILNRIDSILSSYGLTRSQFVALGEAGQLGEPELRDLWLIWGMEIAEEINSPALSS